MIEVIARENAEICRDQRKCLAAISGAFGYEAICL